MNTLILIAIALVMLVVAARVTVVYRAKEADVVTAHEEGQDVADANRAANWYGIAAFWARAIAVSLILLSALGSIR